MLIASPLHADKDLKNVGKQSDTNSGYVNDLKEGKKKMYFFFCFKNNPQKVSFPLIAHLLQRTAENHVFN